ncbi:zinc-finger protein, partial [Marasmius crinis-equi]
LSCCPDFTPYMNTAELEQQQLSLQKAWDDFGAFICSCSKTEEPLNNNLLSNVPPSPVAGNFAGPSHYQPSHSYGTFEQSIPSNPFPPSNGAGFPPASLASTISYSQVPILASAPSIEPLRCMWANCQAQFSTSQQLIEHVNAQHLADSIFGCQSLPDQQTNCQVLCPWGDCHEQLLAEFVAGNEGQHSHSHTDTLSMHLFESHLNFSNLDFNPPVNRVTQGHATAPLQDNSVDFLQHDFSFPRQDEHLDSSSISSTSQSPAFPSSPSLPTSPDTPHTTVPSSHVEEECTGKHICLWESCGQTFATCSELTEHLTNAHVGSGKQRYECFWEGCTRNYKNAGKEGEKGEKEGGFTSKQKICRHLQVSLLSSM